MRRWVGVIAGILVWAAGAAGAGAQAIRLDVAEAPLEDVLRQLRLQTGLDIVFAHRLVDGRRATCRYEGEKVAAALDCLLEDTGLRAERVRRRQYVLVDVGAAEPDAAPRGLITGFVVDAETREVLPGAHVYLPDLRLGTVTNDAGYFALAALPHGPYTVRLSFVGFEPLVVTLRPGAEAVTIHLEPLTVTPAALVVEEERSNRVDLSVVPGVVAVSTSRLEQLPSFPGERDLLQALQWFPGVQKAGEVDGGLVVRGGEPDQNLYLLDGAPVYHPWHAFSLISTFQTETFKDIKLYRGTYPAEHGGRLSAVLDAQLKDGSRTTPGAVAALSVLSGRFLIESPVTRNSSFMLSGRRSYLDKLIGREHPVESTDGRRDTLRTGYHFYDMTAKYTVRAGRNHRFAASFYHGGDNLDLRLPFDLSFDFSDWLRPADLFFEIRQHWENLLFSARYQYLYSSRFFVTTTAYRSGYRAVEAAYLQPSPAATLDSDYRVRLSDLGLKVNVDYYPALGHEVQAGLHVVERRFRSSLGAVVHHSPGAVDTLDQDSRLHAAEIVAYVQDTWQPSPYWTLQPGLRASFFGGGRYVRFSPGLNAQYALLQEQLVLRGGVGLQVQYLHRLRDRYAFMYDLVSSRWIPAGDAVKPSSSVQATVGVETHPFPWLALSSDVYVRVARDVLLPEDAFRRKDGLVGPGIEVGTLLGQYTPGRARAYGVELTAVAERGPWQAWLSYAGGRSFNRAAELGETTYRPARFDVPRSFRGVVHREGRRWDATVAAEVRSGYPHTVPVARYALGDPLGVPGEDEPTAYLYRPYVNNGRLPPYFHIDLMAGYRFDWLGARWRAHLYLYNVTNRRNVISREYDPAADVVRADDRRGFPILPLFELEMKL